MGWFKRVKGESKAEQLRIEERKTESERAQLYRTLFRAQAEQHKLDEMVQKTLDLLEPKK